MKRQNSASAGFTADDLLSATSTEPAIHESASGPLLRLAESMGALDSRPPYSPVVIAGVVRLAEFAVLCLAGIVAEIGFGGATGHLPIADLLLIPALAGVAGALFKTLRLYSLAAFRRPVRASLPMTAGWAIAMLGGAALLVLVHPDHKVLQPWLLVWSGAGLLALLISRTIVFLRTRTLTREGRLERRTVIVGGGKAGEELLDALARQPDSDLRIYGVFDDRRDARSPDVVAGYPKLGNVSDLVAFARKTRIDLVIFTMPITAEERLLQMLRKLWVLPIDIRLAAHRNKLRLRPRSYSYIGDVPVLDVFDKPIADWDIVVKAVFDRLVGAMALIALSPVLALTAIAVKLDSKGPVLFKQKRHGFNNESVEVYKFRSLYADQSDFAATKQVTRDDPRVTRVGRFIRKTSIDELPQLFNVVFKGDLSLVGPRPHAVHAQLANRAYDDVVDGYFARHRVKPGITGWAQVNGWRGETDTPIKIQKRVEHDLAYIENWSILFDLYILLRTPFALTKTENAY